MAGPTSILGALLRVGVGAAAAALLVGCTSLQSTDNFLGLITPYRIDIVQGNAITSEMVAKVRPGLTRTQVRDLLGSPMLADPFHANRWDYVFTFRRPGSELQRRSVVAHFEGDVLKKLDAPTLPSEKEFVAAISSTKASGKATLLELDAAQKQALPVPPKVEAVAVVPLGAIRVYPPLEPQ